MCNLADLGYTDNRFTWFRAEGREEETKERLDRFVTNNSFIRMFNDIDINHLNRHYSDHRPIMPNLRQIDRCVEDGKNRKPIRFEECLADFEECKNIVYKH